MSATLAIATSANANAAIAAQQATEAQRTACAAFMPTFNGATATPELAQAYGRCVDLVYPAASNYTAWRYVVAAMLLGMVVGMLRPVWCRWADRKNYVRWQWPDFEDVALSGVIGFVLASVAVLVAGGVLFVLGVL